MKSLPYAPIDADGHVMERPAELRQYLPEPYAGMEWIDTHPFFPTLDGWSRAMTSPGRRDVPDAELWLRFLDDSGIEQTFVYPTSGLAHGLIQDPKWAVAIAQAYNSWLHDRYMSVSPRIHGVALLPVQNVPAAVEELRRAVTELHMRAALLPGATGLAKGLGHSDFHPLFAEAERLNCAIAIHGAPSKGWGFDYFDKFIKTHTLEHPFAVFTQLTDMMFEGVFELFPKLRVAYLECGCGWVPFMMDRLDEEFERRGERDAPVLKHRPSDYLRGGNIFVSCEVEERSLPFAVQMMGEGQIFFASDYPHERAHDEYLHDIPEFLERGDLTAGVKRKILRDNAQSFYGLTA